MAAVVVVVIVTTVVRIEAGVRVAPMAIVIFRNIDGEKVVFAIVVVGGRGGIRGSGTHSHHGLRFIVVKHVNRLTSTNFKNNVTPSFSIP